MTSRCLIIALTLMFSSSSMAAFVCGGWKLDVNSAGETTLNGQVTDTQKITFLKKDGDYANIKMDMALSSSRDGNMYGFEFIKRAGRAFLNVQLLQARMDAPKVFGTFDCHKVN
ncbi:hypothetical protein BS639_17220 [Rouxiella silvae]|uniref:Secreted protein n=1 Tax=Rouxiella silvae TaxID=1646373 RepID=A0ABX3TXU8_9GAMM|nr:hypothetical protein [Rouxiella silvae]ORJ20034.1 hypothetical protein BS639_17220 [Rouxiella silvae]